MLSGKPNAAPRLRKIARDASSASTTRLHSASTCQHHADRLGLSCAITTLLDGGPAPRHGKSLRPVLPIERYA
jgi:hypothetical protein